MTPRTTTSQTVNDGRQRTLWRCGFKRADKPKLPDAGLANFRGQGTLTKRRVLCYWRRHAVQHLNGAA